MITVAQLHLRRRYVAASNARRPARKVPAAAPPRGPILAATAALTDVGAAMDRALVDELARAGVLRASARRDGPADGDAPWDLAILPATATRLVATITRRLTALAGGSVLARTMAAVAAQVDAHAAAQFARQLQSVIGIDPGTPDYDTRQLREQFRDENLALIRTLADDKVDRVRAILLAAGAGGRVEGIQKAIEEETGATPARAALIARDQVLKLNAQVTEERHTAAGITHYVWRTSRDQRVRKGHRDLEGKTFEYRDPPVVDERTGRRENPGQDYRCRCTAEPVIPGLDA
jgi:SPP1 gp7 family putative phage head morphogenesis protein